MRIIMHGGGNPKVLRQPFRAEACLPIFNHPPCVLCAVGSWALGSETMTFSKQPGHVQADLLPFWSIAALSTWSRPLGGGHALPVFTLACWPCATHDLFNCQRSYALHWSLDIHTVNFGRSDTGHTVFPHPPPVLACTSARPAAEFSRAGTPLDSLDVEIGYIPIKVLLR